MVGRLPPHSLASLLGPHSYDQLASERSNSFGKGLTHTDVQEEGRRKVPVVTGGRTLAAKAA